MRRRALCRAQNVLLVLVLLSAFTSVSYHNLRSYASPPVAERAIVEAPAPERRRVTPRRRRTEVVAKRPEVDWWTLGGKVPDGRRFHWR